MSLDANIVFPGQPFHVDLAALDACHPVHYSRRLLLFQSTSPEQLDRQIASLKTGIQGLLHRCPILGGVVTTLPPDEAQNAPAEWRTIVPGPGLELVIRDLRTSLPSFEMLQAVGFPPSSLPYSLLVPVPIDIDNTRPFAACLIQLSIVEGGIILAWAMSHCVADGAGNNELMRILSEETRAAQGISRITEATRTCSEATVGLDRTPLRNITSDIPFRIEDHPGYASSNNPTISHLSAEQAKSLEATSPEISVLLRLSAAGLAQLKADATPPDASWISSHDALSALLWRSVLFIRNRRSSKIPPALLASTPGSIFMPSDARPRINLSPSYIGNAVYQLAATIDIGTLLSPSGLHHGAKAIRSAISAVTPELVRSVLARTNKEWVDWAFIGTFSTTGVAMGTDWTSDCVYKDDWGSVFGPVVSYRYPGVKGQAFNCIMPKPPGGGAELLVSVMPEEVEILRGSECFGKYLE